jgi:shikimate dehydrogenase
MAHPDRFLLAGVVGWPVMHSRSPLLHNYWFKRHGLAGTYVPLAIAPEGLSAALRALQPLGFAGVNLTIPHKQHAMTLVDEVDPVAIRIGAISCVVVKPDGSLVGSNNDCFGFVHNLKQSMPAWRANAGPIVVLGAGGGARAVCYGLLQEGAKKIRLVNRTLARANGIAAEFGSEIDVLTWDEREDALAGAAMVVNATSQGMAGQA